MSNPMSLAERFEQNRSHLATVAYRMLGSREDAEDAIQETWVRLNGTNSADIANLRGWLTTVVARICLDVLRSRSSRREDSLDDEHAESPADAGEAGDNAEAELVLADSVGIALSVVLETLAPAERVALVLHDMFDIPFDDVARVVGKSPEAARQLASRARRRLRGASTDNTANREHQRRLVEAFLAASRSGDLAGLLELLDPEVVLLADDAAVLMGATREVRGPSAVAETFKGRAVAAQLMLIDGLAGLVWSPGGVPRVVFTFTIVGEKISAVRLIADRNQFEQLNMVDPNS